MSRVSYVVQVPDESGFSAARALTEAAVFFADTPDASAWDQALYAFLVEKGQGAPAAFRGRDRSYVKGEYERDARRAAAAGYVPVSESWREEVDLAVMDPAGSLWQAGAGARGVSSGTFYGRFRRYLANGGATADGTPRAAPHCRQAPPRGR